MLELECDERACRGMDDEERLAYLDALKHVLCANRSEKKKRLDLGMGYTMSHAGKFLKRRFLEVLEPVQKQSGYVTILLAIICFIIFCLSYSFIVQPGHLPKTLEMESAEISSYADGNEEVSDFLIKLSDHTYLYVSGMETKGKLTEQEVQNPPYNGLPIYVSKP
jgi:hypothetical protein